MLIDLLAILLGAVLWSIGGSDFKYSRIVRRVLFPILITIIAILKTHLIIIPLLVGLLVHLATRIGYGLPCIDDPKPSVIGKFWYSKFPDEKVATILTRITVGLIYSLSFIPLLWISPWYAISMILITAGLPIIVIFNLGKWEEVVIGAYYSALFLIMR
jgi:hypothetical protein